MSILNDMFVQVDKLTNLKNEFLITFNTWKNKKAKNKNKSIEKNSTIAICCC